MISFSNFLIVILILTAIVLLVLLIGNSTEKFVTWQVEKNKKKEESKWELFVLDTEDLSAVETFITFKIQQQELVESINQTLQEQEKELVRNILVKNGIDQKTPISINKSELPLARIRRL